jgi:hypothetical protein
MNRIILRCECIDQNSLYNLRLGLLTARDTYNDIAAKLIEIGTNKRMPNEIIDIQTQATRFDDLIAEIGKIPPCESEK